MANNDRNEVNEWLNSDGGTLAVQGVLALIVIGVIVHVITNLHGLGRIAAILVTVGAIALLVWRLFFRRNEE